jgi:hypothetical protein
VLEYNSKHITLTFAVDYQVIETLAVLDIGSGNSLDFRMPSHSVDRVGSNIQLPWGIQLCSDAPGQDIGPMLFDEGKEYAIYMTVLSPQRDRPVMLSQVSGAD